MQSGAGGNQLAGTSERSGSKPEGNGQKADGRS